MSDGIAQILYVKFISYQYACRGTAMALSLIDVALPHYYTAYSSTAATYSTISLLVNMRAVSDCLLPFAV